MTRPRLDDHAFALATSLLFTRSNQAGQTTKAIPPTGHLLAAGRHPCGAPDPGSPNPPPTEMQTLAQRHFTGQRVNLLQAQQAAGQADAAALPPRRPTSLGQSFSLMMISFTELSMYSAWPLASA